MSDQPITGYKLSQLRVVPVGADLALVTYFADVKTPGDKVEHQMAVGEIWWRHVMKFHGDHAPTRLYKVHCSEWNWSRQNIAEAVRKLTVE